MGSRPSPGLVARIARNTGWLTGARGFTGLLSIVYLGIASRALGLEGFGIFTLVMTYGQLITNLVQFQSIKGVIRFGAHHLESKPARLARLFGAMAVFDGLGFLIGAVIAVSAIPIAGRLLHWNGHLELLAGVFAVVLLAASGGTPAGVLRLRNRFDTLAAIEAMGPTIRLCGAAIAWISGGGIAAFLAVWAFAALCQNIAQWIAMMRLPGTRVRLGLASFRKAVRENDRLWRFMVMTNFANSLSLFWMQLGTFAIGAVVGPAEAGGFRIAHRIAKGIGNPIELLTRALYPEFARSLAQRADGHIRGMLARTTLTATGLGALLVLLIALAGKSLLVLIAGPQFGFAAGLLLLLTVSTALDFGSFALDPYLTAKGRAGLILRVRLVGALTYALILAASLPRCGGTGAGLAAIGASAVMFIQLVQATWGTRCCVANQVCKTD